MEYNTKKVQFITKPQELEIAEDFLLNFQTSDHEFIYFEQLQEISNMDRTHLEISLDDVESYIKDPVFTARIIENTYRYISIFAVAAYNKLPSPSENIQEKKNVYDLWIDARARQSKSTTHGSSSLDETFREMAIRFEVHFYPLSRIKPFPLRHIRSDHIGQLLSVRGIVIKASDVVPLVSIQAYYCNICGCESYQHVNNAEYTPLLDCQSQRCKNNNSKGDLLRVDRGSKFRSFQEIKIQELPAEVPVGHIPRSMRVKLYGHDLVQKQKPGDITQISGIFLPTPRNKNSHSLPGRYGLLTDTYLEASRIEIAKRSYHDMIFDDIEMNELDKLSSLPDIFTRLASSICPEIYGHIEVKKALLLSMIGGITQTMNDGMKIRGDINILLVGDPGMAKSQLLKHIAKISPRGIYTTGKGVSGAGLTASVIKDPTSGDIVLEGGALVLADNGICCIDEFDKMVETDRSAIHEVMEQQIVSIAKAGITTCLNARATIIAAANPIYGRYNPKVSPSENLNLPTSLLSRFDLQYILIDQPNQEFDSSLASHITYVHRYNIPPKNNFTYFTSTILRAYISRAKQFQPILTKEAAASITQYYIDIRQLTLERDRCFSRTNNSQHNDRGQFCTARMLLSTVRLAQAIARLHFSATITQHHASIAINMLIYAFENLHSIYNNTKYKVASTPTQDIYSRIYQLILEQRTKTKDVSITLSNLKNILYSHGYIENDIDMVLKMYEETGVWMLTNNPDTLKFIAV